MNRLFLCIIFLSCTLSFCSARENECTTHHKVCLNFKRDKTSIKHQRAPMCLPVEVEYDEEEGTVTVIAEEGMVGEAYLDYQGCILYSSPSLDVTFDLPFTSAVYTIHIRGEGWEATGSFCL